jgi:hypothetical protein
MSSKKIEISATIVAQYRCHASNFVSLILEMETTPLYDGILTEDQLLDSMVLLNEYTTFWDGKVKELYGQ